MYQKFNFRLQAKISRAPTSALSLNAFRPAHIQMWKNYTLPHKRGIEKTTSSATEMKTEIATILGSNEKTKIIFEMVVNPPQNRAPACNAAVLDRNFATQQRPNLGCDWVK